VVDGPDGESVKVDSVNGEHLAFVLVFLERVQLQLQKSFREVLINALVLEFFLEQTPLEN
jgi:hypothetical protein